MDSTIMSPTKHINLDNDTLIKMAVENEEGVIAANGALATTTGERTGRSPKDKYIVDDKHISAEICWGEVNQPIDGNTFTALWSSAEAYLAEREAYVTHAQIGADSNYAISVKVITEYAWHQLFARHMFIIDNSKTNKANKIWTILNVPGFKTEPNRDKTNSDGAVIIHLSARRILLCGMQYAGEMKKAAFSVQNFLLPGRNVLPMHCAANCDHDGNVALFFGLSGTGKTTLSADPDRALIGDDEHGWSKEGVFNLEGGCYAKCINLSAKHEPVIYNAIHHPAVMENVVIDPITREPIYNDSTLTNNTRVAYPRTHIPQRVLKNAAGHPKAVIFLTCDLYGVLPPISCLNTEQAAYYFLSGYTALVGSTEIGSATEIKSTFSCCFGAPFFPLYPQVYSDLLMMRLNETKCPVYLLNTGWCGGAYGEGGKRFPIPTTRALLKAIYSGEVGKALKDRMPGFNFEVPVSLKGIDADILMPYKNGLNNETYKRHLQSLIGKFRENFNQYDVQQNIVDAGPKQI
jgi:phosphoenolpyruvate carboxykinase (ATP)